MVPVGAEAQAVLEPIQVPAAAVAQAVSVVPADQVQLVVPVARVRPGVSAVRVRQVVPVVRARQAVPVARARREVRAVPVVSAARAGVRPMDVPPMPLSMWPTPLGAVQTFRIPSCLFVAPTPKSS